MLKFLRRLFGWFTLISLILWAGVAVYILMVQYRDVPPMGWPSNYRECVVRWSATDANPSRAAQVKTRCADYYALLGDRDAPWYKRLQQQVQGRLTESVVDAYLKLSPPKPGDVVTGPQVMAALGSARMAQMFYDTLRAAHLAPSIRRRTQLRCMLEETRRSGVAVDPAYITQQCMQH